MDDDILLSWISEYAYCRRRFYLRYVECMNAASADMVEGRYEHRIVDDRHIIRRGSHIIVSRLYVSSEKYSMHGLCDNVEFDEAGRDGVYIPYLNGLYGMTPVEFKHGKIRQENEYEQQLCAQALCLEEMYDTDIESGIIYYVDSKDRYEIHFSDELRKKTVDTIQNIRSDLEQIASGASSEVVFPSEYMRKCVKCSLFDICNPKTASVDRYMKSLWTLGEKK